MRPPAARLPRRSEHGAALIVALVLMLAISIVILAVSNFAVGAASNTYNLASQRTLIVNAEGAVSAAISNLRTQYSATGSGGNLNPQACLPSQFSSFPSSGGSGAQIVVYCSGTFNPLHVPTRTITFYACPSPDTSCLSTSADLVMSAAVGYDDIDPSVPVTVNPCTTTCGVSVSVTAWDVKGADT